MNARTVRYALVAVTLVFVTLLGCGVSADAGTPPAPQLPHFIWGAWIGDQFTGQQPPWDWKAVKKFEAVNTGGRHISALHWGVRNPWDYDFNYWRGALDIARENGAISVIDMGTDSVPLRDIAAGDEDAALKTWATQAASWGQPVLLRFDFEMNGRWFPWGTAPANQNRPADFVAAWRHVHDIFTAAGATNVLWVWCPNIALHHDSHFFKLYPGSSYVDWTCLDGYNFGHPWKSFTKIYQRSYNLIMKVAPNKPMLVGEVGSVDRGGNKALWISNMFQALATRFRHIHGLLWYDVRGGPGNWPIESSKASSAAFSSGIASTLARVCRPYGGLAKAQCLGKAPPPS
jgi:hypothetical protein